MDEKLERALEFSNYQKTLQIKKDNLKLRLAFNLICKHGMNVFTASKELISFVSINLKNKNFIIKDNADIPVEINNTKEFYELLTKTYNKAYVEYLDEYNKIKRARNVEKVVE